MVAKWSQSQKKWDTVFTGIPLILESIAKRMIKYLLFARSHEIWQREIL